MASVAVDNSTYQLWTFSMPDLTPPPDVVENPYGDPLLRVDSTYWSDEMGAPLLNHGVWALGQIDVYIPNRDIIDGWKDILLELVWKPGMLDDPFLPNQPNILVTPWDQMEASRVDTDLGDGWVKSVYEITIWPNPAEEWIAIKGNILVDGLVITTTCIPEPATIALLGLGALALLRKRKA